MVHVILVERNDAMRAAATAALLDRGHAPIALPSADDAVGIVRFVRVDVLIAETAPFGGPGLADQVRRFHPDARIILTTSRSESASLLYRAIHEEWHLLRRPYRVEQILALLN